MRWRGRRQSSNIEDKRGMRAPRMARLGAGGGGIVRLLPLVFRVLGFKGTLVAVALVVGYGYFSGDLERFLGGGGFETSHPGRV